MNDYHSWLKINPTKEYSTDEQELLDNSIRDRIYEDLTLTGDLQQKENMLKHKWFEIHSFIKKDNSKEIDIVKNLIWKPSPDKDFRDIEPELLLTTELKKVPTWDFWGNENYQVIIKDNKLTEHWTILRTLISSSRNDGTRGRALRYLVRDKSTQKYLGIICISSTAMLLNCRNKIIFGEDNNQFQTAFSIGGRSKSMGNGQTIQPLQPFGRVNNGGKLLALLCVSDVIQKDWQERYGDVLVAIETTSLYGNQNKLTQYCGLRPFFKNIGQTSGQTPIKPTDVTYKLIRKWIKKRYPETYYQYIHSRNEKGQNTIRDQKNNLVKKVYSLLNINRNIYSQYRRGVFLCSLYENTNDFMQYKIDEDLLKPSFNNDIETLIHHWKYGFDDNSKLSHLSKNKYKLEKRSTAEHRHNSLKNNGVIYRRRYDDWYGDLHQMDWETAKQKYLYQEFV